MASVMIDSSAWIELFEGTETGKRVQKILNESTCLTPSIVVAEVCSRTRRKGGDVNVAYNEMCKADIIPLTGETGRIAGEFHATQRIKKPSFGIVDSVIIATARASKAKLLTCDADFKTFPETILLK